MKIIQTQEKGHLKHYKKKEEIVVIKLIYLLLYFVLREFQNIMLMETIIGGLFLVLIDNIIVIQQIGIMILEIQVTTMEETIKDLYYIIL